VAQALSGCTASLRFPGSQNNADIRKLCTNLVPFSRLHFMTLGLAPLFPRGEAKYQKLEEKELVAQMLDSRAFLSESDPKSGKILASCALFRGSAVSPGEVEKCLLRYTDKHSSRFVEWVPNRIMNATCPVPPPYLATSAVCLANTSAIHNSMERILDQFGKMFKRKAFVHWYTEEGVAEEEFEEVAGNVRDLISEY